MVVVAVFIEPAPYILDLLRVIRQRNPDVHLRVYFITAALTQNWGGSLDGVAILLPDNRWSALKYSFRISFVKNRMCCIWPDGGIP
jgi:hypothetical protein